MKFLLLVCWDAERMNAQTEPDPTDTPDEESFPWLDDLQARGIWITGDQLAPPRKGPLSPRSRGEADSYRRSVRRDQGGARRHHGCGSLEEAVEIAAAHPIAQTGTIEVRPLWGN